MTLHVCDDCGGTLHASWFNGSKWGTPDLELCSRCYDRRVRESRQAPGAVARPGGIAERDSPTRAKS